MLEVLAPHVPQHFDGGPAPPKKPRRRKYSIATQGTPDPAQPNLREMKICAGTPPSPRNIPESCSTLLSFYQLMVQFLGSRDALAAKLIAEKGAFANISMFPYGLEFLRPYSCAPPDRGGRLWFLFWRNGETFIYRTQVGVYQYIIIKALMTVLFFITSLTNTLGSSSDYTAFVRDRRGRAASTHPRPTTTTTTTHPTRAGPAFVRSYPSCPHS